MRSEVVFWDVVYPSPDIIRQVKANEMGGAYSTHGTEKFTRFWRESPKDRDHLEDGIRMDLRQIGLGGVGWIRLAQDRDRWRAAVMNLRVLAPRSVRSRVVTLKIQMMRGSAHL
jgi:hypothetical protein